MIDCLLCLPLFAFRCWDQPLLWTIKRIFSGCGKCFKYRMIFLIIFCCVFRCDYKILYFTCFPSKALDFKLKCHLGEKKRETHCVKLIIPLLYLWYLLCQMFWPFCVYSLWRFTLGKSIGKMSIGGAWKSPAQTCGKQCEMDYCCYIRVFFFLFALIPTRHQAVVQFSHLQAKLISFMIYERRQLDEITWGS